jgi:site-specific DNA-methyltransferase (adenine-specific)
MMQKTLFENENLIEPQNPAFCIGAVSRSTLLFGDCLIESDKIESGSVDLILTDLPFGTMKGLDAEPIKSDNDKNYVAGGGYKKGYEWDAIIEPKKVYEVANRILRKNGKMVLFCQEPFTTLLINEAIPNVPFSYRAIWEKNDFANCLFAKKAMVNYYEDILIFSKNHDTEDLHPLRSYLKECKIKSGMTNKQFNTLFSDFYNKKGCRDRSVLEHYWAAAQFTMPTEEIYKMILQPTGFFPLPYEELKAIDDKFKKEFASTFNLWEGNKYKSNILKYKKDYNGYHPTQKPILLLEDLIKTFSNENDLVVDLTMGSGSTGVACKNTNRNFIGIENNMDYFNISLKRVEEKRKEKEFSVVTSFGDGM